MKIAIEGCAHGELEKIYDLIENIEEKEGVKVDLLICCGDFQSTRNLEDLQCMAVPKKHLDICTFYKYYSGEKKAPVLTIFIGGNHEASNYLQELPYGGWVAPNIYYLGYAGVVNVNGIRIGGISGIYKGHDFFRGRHEFLPYNESSKRSVYHIRQIDVFRLKQLTPDFDILLSHDWPRGVYNHGNLKQLLRFKPAFREDIESNKLGSPPCEDLLQKLKPTYWFAAHLHCKFSAVIPHEDNPDKYTKFLALDKCLPKRRFLQLIDIDTKEECGEKAELMYDLEWLTILNLTNHLISVKNCPGYMPGENSPERFNFRPTEMEKQQILDRFENNLKIPLNFTKIVEPYNPLQGNNIDYIEQPKAFLNPQTTDLIDKLNIDDPLRLAMIISGKALNTSNYADASVIDIEDEDDDDEDEEIKNETLEMSTDIIEDNTLSRTTLASVLPEPKWRHDTQNSDLSGTLEEDSSLSISNRSIISLPTPKKSDSAPDNLLDELNLSSPKPKPMEEVIESTKLENKMEQQEDNTNQKPPSKKFKRRNQSIYANNESD